MKNEAMVLLVKETNLVDKPQMIALNHDLYISTNRIESDSIKQNDEYFTPIKTCIEEGLDGFEGETSVSDFFSTENEFYHENCDFLQIGLGAIKIDNELWILTTIEDQYYAINPLASWSNEKETFVL